MICQLANKLSSGSSGVEAIGGPTRSITPGYGVWLLLGVSVHTISPSRGVMSMSDGVGSPKLEWPESSVTREETEVPGGPKKLAVMNPPTYREPRPVTNLGKVFGQFAELQQQISEQVGALEDSVHNQRQDMASAVAPLRELREALNWVI